MHIQSYMNIRKYESLYFKKKKIIYNIIIRISNIGLNIVQEKNNTLYENKKKVAYKFKTASRINFYILCPK
jgi:hypothetical protein